MWVDSVTSQTTDPSYTYMTCPTALPVHAAVMSAHGTLGGTGHYAAPRNDHHHQKLQPCTRLRAGDIPDLLRGWYSKPGAWERVTCWGKLKETRITLEETPAASWRCVRRRHIPTVVSYGRCCKPLAKLPILS